MKVGHRVVVPVVGKIQVDIQPHQTLPNGSPQNAKVTTLQPLQGHLQEAREGEGSKSAAPSLRGMHS